MSIQIHEGQRIPNRLNPNRATLRYVITELSKVKVKEIILKAAREITYKTNENIIQNTKTYGMQQK